MHWTAAAAEHIEERRCAKHRVHVCGGGESPGSVGADVGGRACPVSLAPAAGCGRGAGSEPYRSSHRPAFANTHHATHAGLELDFVVVCCVQAADNRLELVAECGAPAVVGPRVLAGRGR